MNIASLTGLVVQGVKARRAEVFALVPRLMALNHPRLANDTGGGTSCDCEYCEHLRRYVHAKIRLRQRQSFLDETIGWPDQMEDHMIKIYNCDRVSHRAEMVFAQTRCLNFL